MAYQDENEKLLDPNAQQGQQNQSQGSSAPSIVDQGSNAVGSGVNSAGVGAGGTGKWTNIQAYLGANKDVDTGAKDMLNDQVGSQFDKEKSDIGSETDKLKSDAEKAYQPVGDVEANGQKYLDEAAGGYDYGGNHGDPYKKALGAFSGALDSQYNGPKNYAHDISGKSQGYNSALGSDEGFNQLLGDMYQDKAGGQLSSGGRALQSQLNVSNAPLAAARKALLAKYSGLTNYRDQAVKDTDEALGQTANKFAQGQSHIKDFLNNKSNYYDSAVAQEESKAHDAYNTTYKSGSGRASAAYGELGSNPLYGGGLANSENNLGLYGDNLTWNQLENLQNGTTTSGKKFSDLYKTPYNAATARGLENMNALDMFKNSQFEKYSGTGDQEKKRFNLIQDILKSNTARKKQGFDVRA